MQVEEKRTDKKIAGSLDCRGINFPLKARDHEIIKYRFGINVNIFGYQNKVFPKYI